MPRQTADYDPMMDELPPELAAEYMKEKRRRSISEAMLGQSMEPLQAPEVKGRFQGAISPFQGLAQIAKAYIANKGLEGSDAALEGIGGRVSEGRNAAIQKMTQAMTGTPEQVLPADVYGPAKPAVPGSVDAGISIGMESPYTQKIAQAMLLEKMKNQIQMKPTESPWAKVDAKDYTPESLKAFSISRNPADLVAIQKSTTGKLGTEDVHIGGGQWQSFKVGKDGEVDLNAPIGKPFTKRPTASDVNVSANAAVPKGDSKYAENRMGDAAKAMTDLTKSAESAYKANKALDRFTEASKNGTQGGAQPLITGVQNFISSFGYSAESLKDVRQMEQAVGDILGSKMAELGARGLTDKDMEVLRMSLPKVETDRVSRENVVKILKKANENVINEWEGQREQEIATYPELSKRIPEPVWYRDHKKFRSIVPTDSANPYSEMSDAEIKAALGDK